MALETLHQPFGLEQVPEEGLVAVFLAEYRQLAQEIRNDILAVAKTGPELDPELALSVLSAIHRIRGAVFLGLSAIAFLAARLEETWLSLTQGKVLAPRATQLRAMLIALDQLRDLIDQPTARIADLTAILPAPQSEFPESPPKLRSLVVEDDLGGGELLKSVLARHGPCDLAPNFNEGAEAVASAISSNCPYHLICMEVFMPDEEGREKIRHLRASERHGPTVPPHRAKLVLIAAVDDPKEKIRCFEDFTDAYARKPINPALLIRQLKVWRMIS